MLFPKTIRLDQSDVQVFERAAEPGELAVSGAFAFADLDPESGALAGKTRQAFANGLMGTESFGWSTFIAVAKVSDEAYQAMIERLADHFVADYGAPDREAALAAARGEAEFAAGLCEHEVNTLLTVEREFGPDGIVERFRVVQPPDDYPLGRVWDMVYDDDGV